MWFDLLILGIVGYSAIRGAIKGIVWQLAIIGALLGCFAFAEPLSVYLAPSLPVEAPLNRWLAMLVIYLVFAFLSFAIARKLRLWIEAWKFVEYDRHVGALFGLVKGVVFSLVLTFFMVTLSDRLRGEILNSRSGYAAAIIMDRLHPVMPAELHDVLEPFIHQLDRPGMDLQHAHDDDDADFDQHEDGHQSHAAETAHESAHSAGQSNNDHAADGTTSIQDLLSSIPPAVDEGLRELVAQALENTAPEDRAELLERLQPATPELLRMVAREWQFGKPR